MATSTTPRTTRRPRLDPVVARWRNAVFVVFGTTGFVFATWVSRIPGVRDILGASTQQMGLLLIGISAGSIIGLVGSSHIVARFGATRTILVLYSIAGLAVAALGLVLAVAPSFGAIFVCLLFFGFGHGATDVAMNLSGAMNERAAQRTIMPLYHAAFSLGTVLGAGIGALAILAGVPIGLHLGVIGLLSVATIWIAVRWLQPAEQVDDADAAPETARARLAVWANPRILLIGVLVLGMAFAEGSANDWLPLAMVDGHGLDNAAGAAAFGVFVAAMTVGRIAGVPLLDRFGRVPVLRGSAALAVAGLLLVIFGSVPLALVGVVLWGLGAALGFPVGMSAAADDPKRAAANVSAVATMGYLAFLVGPPGIGLLGEHVGLLPALLVVLVLIAIAGLVSGAAREPAKR